MTSEATDPVDILITALRTPGSKVALDEVHQNGAKIMEAIGKGSAVQLSIEDLDPSWVAQIGAVLDKITVTDDAFTIESSPIYSEASWDEAEAEIGKRFADMVRSLPWDLSQFTTLADLPPATPESRDSMLASPAGSAAESVGADLAEYGLSPLTFTYAAQGVARVLRKGRRKQRQSGVEVCVTAEEQIEEIAAFCRIEKNVARKLLIWLQQASAYSSDIIPGFVAGMQEKHLYFGKSAAALERRLKSAQFREHQADQDADVFYQEYDAEH